MSSFNGIVSLESTPIDREVFSRMTASIAASGPDRSDQWMGENAAVGQHMLCTTPESLEEKLPFVDEQFGFVIAGDIRLDNRSEILTRLGRGGPEARLVPDSVIVLWAYQRWQEGMLRWLLGDFAFAIWNPQTRDLFLARDHFGVRPCYYARTGGAFYFASEIKALFATGQFSREINFARVKQTVGANNPGHEDTFYEKIYRLPAATWMRVNDRGIVSRCYWRPDECYEMPALSDEEYSERFRELFEQSVRCRLRSAHKVGTHLSGGLDSSAVTCMARDILLKDRGALPLETFSNIFPSIPICDESEYIKAVIDSGGMRSTLVPVDARGPLEDIDRYFTMEEEGVYTANTFLLESLGDAMQKAGVRVCLDGFDGDTTISHGDLRLRELAQRGEWAAFAQEADALANFHTVTKDALFANFGAPRLQTLANEEGIWKYFREARRARKHFRFNIGKVWLKGTNRPTFVSRARQTYQDMKNGNPGPDGQYASRMRYFSNKFAEKLRITDAGDELASPLTVRQDQCSKLSCGLFSFVLEITGRLHSRFGIETRHPFLDKRLVDFCLALPSEMKLRNGKSRVIMRQGLTGVLPEAIQQRTSKANFTSSCIWTAFKHDSRRIEDWISTIEESGNKAIQGALMRQKFNEFRAKKYVDSNEFLHFWSALTLGVWVEKYNLPVPC